MALIPVANVEVFELYFRNHRVIEMGKGFPSREGGGLTGRHPFEGELLPIISAKEWEKNPLSKGTLEAEDRSSRHRLPAASSGCNPSHLESGGLATLSHNGTYR